jgi:hypothetical protein
VLTAKGQKDNGKRAKGQKGKKTTAKGHKGRRTAAKDKGRTAKAMAKI